MFYFSIIYWIILPKLTNSYFSRWLKPPTRWIWGFPSMGTPIAGWFISWKVLFKWMIWGYHHFRKPPSHAGLLMMIFVAHDCWLLLLTIDDDCWCPVLSLFSLRLLLIIVVIIGVHMCGPVHLFLGHCFAMGDNPWIKRSTSLWWFQHTICFLSMPILTPDMSMFGVCFVDYCFPLSQWWFLPFFGPW